MRHKWEKKEDPAVCPEEELHVERGPGLDGAGLRGRGPSTQGPGARAFKGV